MMTMMEEQEEDVVALVRVYRPPRRVRIHWLRVLKDQRKPLSFPVVLILVPTRGTKIPHRISKVLVVGQGRRPGTYEQPPDVGGCGGGGSDVAVTADRMTLGADLRFSKQQQRRPQSTPAAAAAAGSCGRGSRLLVVPEAPRRISTPDLPHPGTKWMD